MKHSFFLIAIILLFTGCLQEDHPFVPFTGIQPQNINDGWEISAPENENINGAELSKIVEGIQHDGDLWQLNSILVFRNQKLVAETYLKDKNDIQKPRPIWSCTKQVLGVLTGMAIEQGVLHSINDSLSTYLSEELKNHPDKAHITLAQLLTMRSGIDFDESKDVSALLQQKPDNVIDFILGRPLKFSPGEKFNYNSGDPHLIAASIQNALGQPLEDWADEQLFSKIGFTNYTWLQYDGYNYGGYGISTTPRELAKIAQLVLNQGAWNGAQIVDKNWLTAMVTTQTQTGDGSPYTFGYQWWVNETEKIYFMSGSGGQYACVVPDKNLLIVAMSEHDTDGDLELDFGAFLELVDKIRGTVY